MKPAAPRASAFVRKASGASSPRAARTAASFDTIEWQELGDNDWRVSGRILNGSNIGTLPPILGTTRKAPAWDLGGRDGVGEPINLVRGFPLGSIFIERIEPQRYIRLGLSSGDELADFKDRSTFAGGFGIKHRRFADPRFAQQHNKRQWSEFANPPDRSPLIVGAVDHLDATVDHRDPADQGIFAPVTCSAAPPAIGAGAGS